jgi:hypothetical protein
MEAAVNTGKLLFAFLPWTSIAASVTRYAGDPRVRALTCAEQFPAMTIEQDDLYTGISDNNTSSSVVASEMVYSENANTQIFNKGPKCQSTWRLATILASYNQAT